MKKTYYIECNGFLNETWREYIDTLHERPTETYTHFLHQRLLPYGATCDGIFLEFETKSGMILFKLEVDHPMEEILKI